MKPLILAAAFFCFTLSPAESAERDLGDLNWFMDLESVVSPHRPLGIEFDGTNFWVSCGPDYPFTYLFEVTPDGTVINQYPYSPYEDFKDLAWDGEFLYGAGINGITQIDPSTGSPTGITYFSGLCRALAYDPVSDSFWTASFGSDLYQVFRDDTYNTYPNPGLAISGAAFELSHPDHPMLWWWSQDGGTGSLASEYDPVTHDLTGRSFEGTTPLGGGMAGGACAREMDKGSWELIGLYQGSPDHMAGHDLAVIPPALTISPEKIKADEGGTVQFSLIAGGENKNRGYAVFGSVHGSVPGTPLPGGITILPVNWDPFTNFFLGLNLPGFVGTLDGEGKAEAVLVVPSLVLIEDITLTFAYALEGPPWDFASNAAELLIEAPPTGGYYFYDDGSSENLMGWTGGGDMCWMHWYDTGPNPTPLGTVSAAFGCPLYPGYNPGNGTPATVYIWDDPNNDGDPLDAVFLAKKEVTVQNVDTDTFNDYRLDTAVTVTGGFFVGVCQNLMVGQYGAPMDESQNPTLGTAWIAGDPGGTSGFDYQNMANNYVSKMQDIGFDCYFLLRAIQQ